MIIKLSKVLAERSVTSRLVTDPNLHCSKGGSCPTHFQTLLLVTGSLTKPERPLAIVGAMALVNVQLVMPLIALDGPLPRRIDRIRLDRKLFPDLEPF